MALISASSQKFRVKPALAAPPGTPAWETGTVGNVQELVEALDVFLQEKAGWYVAKEYGPHDKLYVGYNGHVPMYIRITDTPKTKDPTYVEKAIPHLHVRAYAGFDGVDTTEEYSDWGPWLLSWHYGTGTRRVEAHPLHGGEAHRYEGRLADGLTASRVIAYGLGYVCNHFTTGTAALYSVASNGTAASVNAISLIDSSTPAEYYRNGRPHVFMWRNSLSMPVAEIDFISGEVEYYGPPPDFYNTRAYSVWDGENFIYAAYYTSSGHASSNTFARFSLNDKTWESLPSSPAAPGLYGDLIFLPHPSGDKVLTVNGIRDGSIDPVYAYDINSETWSLFSDRPATTQTTSRLLKDRKGRLWWRRSPSFLYYAEPPDYSEWVRITNTEDTLSSTGLDILDHPVSLAPLVEETKYHFSFYKGRVFVGLGDLTEGLRWMAFGALETPSKVESLQRSVVPGVATAQVSGARSFQPGQWLLLYDPFRGVAERTRVRSVLSSSSISLETDSLLDYPPGTIIAEDPAPVFIGGDTLQATSPTDAGGVKSAGVSASYTLAAEIDINQTLNRGNPPLTPVVLRNPFTGFPVLQETKGRIPGLYLHATGTNFPTPGEAYYVNNKVFMTFRNLSTSHWNAPGNEDWTETLLSVGPR